MSWLLAAVELSLDRYQAAPAADLAYHCTADSEFDTNMVHPYLLDMQEDVVTELYFASQPPSYLNACLCLSPPAFDPEDSEATTNTLKDEPGCPRYVRLLKLSK